MTLYRLLQRVDQVPEEILEILGDVEAGSPGAALRLVPNKTPGDYVAVPVTNWSELAAYEKHVAPQIVVVDKETTPNLLDLGEKADGAETQEIEPESVESIAADALADPEPSTPGPSLADPEDDGA